MLQLEQMTIAGIPTVRATRSQLASLLAYDHARTRLGELSAPRVVVSSNGMVIANFHRDPIFRALMLQAQIIDADGMPLVFASRMFCKKPLTERVATTDFIHDAARVAVETGMRFYFLGGQPGVAHAAALNLRHRHEGLQVVGVRDGYFSLEDEPGICDDIVRQRADVLWVGLGSPKQEAFAVRNRERLGGLTWIRTCGGLFDHMAGRFKRAPLWMQSVGLEWMFRAVQEPKRLGPRYIATNPLAAYHLLKKTHD